MELVVFGLAVSSAWGNGHATLWRGLIQALHRRGHRVVFFERDVSYYARHRDLGALPEGELVLYDDWDRARGYARRALGRAQVAIVTSYCPDAVRATELAVEAKVPRRVFYDLDTPVTLARLRCGEQVPYLGPDGLRPYDLALSYTGGRALDELRSRLGAARAAPLYGHVDPRTHHPSPPSDRFRCDLSYLGTYASDRQDGVERLLLEPARRCPERRFLLGGAQYPPDFPWTENLAFVPHVPPAEHPAFFCSSRLTLSVTRRAMAELGHCPSGRLFEAAACGIPVLSDGWDGLEAFFAPGEEILIARGPQDVLEALDRSGDDLGRIGRRAMARALAEHTSDRRAEQLERLLEL